MQSLPVATSRTYDVEGSCTGMIIHRMRKCDLGGKKPCELMWFHSLSGCASFSMCLSMCRFSLPRNFARFRFASRNSLFL